MFTSAYSLRRTLAVGTAMIVATALVAAPAAAHTELRGSDPDEGATVDTLDQVRLEFSSALLDIGAELVLVDAEGTDHELTPEFPAGEHAVEAAVASDMVAPGDTVLDWRIVAEDGHPIEGEVSFTYAPVAVEEPAEQEAEEPAVEEEPADQSPALEETDAQEDPSAVEPTEEMTPISEEPVSEDPEPEGIAVWAWALMGLAIGGLVVMAIAMGRKREDP